MDCVSKVADVVLGIEAEMRRLDLWEAEPPPLRALSSPEPFCYDTLRFTQWLQWVLVPRMRHIIECGEALPTQSDIFPLAETVLADIPANTDQLLALVRSFDLLIARAATGEAPERHAPDHPPLHG